MSSLFESQEEVSSRIKTILFNRRITQTELAEKSGISFGTLNRILNGKLELKPNTLDKIASGLGVEISELTGQDEPTSPSQVLLDGFVEFKGEVKRIKTLKDLQSLVEIVEKELESAAKKALIFDMDNTLLDTNPLAPYYEPIKKAERGSQEQKAAWAKLSNHIPDCKKYEGMDEVWDYIRDNHIKVCLVSNGPLSRIKKLVKAFNIPIPSSNMVGGFTCGNGYSAVKKPDPRPILKAIEIMDVPPENVVVIGNGPEDIEAARNAGVKSIGCTWGNNEEENETLMKSHPDRKITNPKSIISYIEGKL